MLSVFVHTKALNFIVTDLLITIDLLFNKLNIGNLNTDFQTLMRVYLYITFTIIEYSNSATKATHKMMEVIQLWLYPTQF